MRKPLTACVIGIAALTVAGCEVEQTRETKLPNVDVSVDKGQLPAFEVKQTKEARMPDVDVAMKGGQLPALEVEVADIEVGRKQVTVPVPDVKLKDKDVTLPTIDIEMPDERNMVEEVREKARNDKSESSN